jgi:hypothetical protein
MLFFFGIYQTPLSYAFGLLPHDEQLIGVLSLSASRLPKQSSRDCDVSDQCSIAMCKVCTSNLIGRIASMPYIKENGVAVVVTL